MTDGPTEQLARFATSWNPEVMAPGAISEAKRALLDVVGVALVGSAEESSRIAATVASREGAAGPAAVIGHGLRCSPSHAAFVNGVTSHALDFDASATIKTTGHPVVCVGPAALAAAEGSDASGRELLEAVIVGFEVVSRLGRSAGGDRGDHYERGFHGTSVFGVFGATAAACRLMGLDVEAARNAFGIAASAAKGVRANYGTMTKPLHAGEASRAGVMAALLAAEGFTAATDAIEAPLGWASAVVAHSFDPAELTKDLGLSLAIAQGVNYKRFPSCGATHAPIRATLRLMSDNHLRPEDVEEVEVSMLREALEKTLVFAWPSSPLEGKFCAPYVVAAAWADGRVGVDTFTDAKLRELAPYRSRIRVHALEGRPNITVSAWTRDGRWLSAVEPGNYFDDPKGAPALTLSDLSDEELRQKFRDNLKIVNRSHTADALIEELDHLDRSSSLRGLTDLLL